ncbi:MAG: magnesium-translocating P-type ATPase [Clostridiales bacterium]|nr:magnesium-translocating P-type ATPase [Clostridiales bacterium]
MSLIKKRRLKDEHKQAQFFEESVREQAKLNLDELLIRLETTQEGLTSETAEKKLDDFGKNIITAGTNNTVWHRLREAVINPFNIILLVIAVVTYITDVVTAPSPDYITVSIILALVLLSSGLSFVQSERSNKAAEELSKKISNKADVYRDGRLIEISMDEVVPGDVVKLSAGDMLPGDVRFIRTKDTFVAQAPLTGESLPVEKFSHIDEDEDESMTDIGNIGFMGSDIISGSADAVVLSSGNSTYLGSMAKSLSGNRAQSSFERGVSSVSMLLVRMMLLLVPIVFLINGLAKGDWAQAFLFAVSVAVGLTPQMLPMIMTSTLAKGAVNMSKHKVIVRTLGAIQSFGEMDVLCTDKTGTLTEDKIVLEKYMNLHGEDDQRILRHAYINSYFQTGLKNLIDLAIINRATQYGLEYLLDKYHIVDEIPFDFTRRRMSVVLEDTTGKRQLITKGAVEEMMAISSFAEMNGQIVALDDDIREQAMKTYNQYNTQGLRIIAVAQKNEVPDSHSFGVEDESDMVLIGFVGFLDPPKESAKIAIDALREHGVRTVVLTGDSEGVAIKVCNKVGIKTDIVMTGRNVEAMDDTALLAIVRECDLFAKLTPIQKERVVKAFQTNGHTVGYMGDGINDAQAMRQADVGISVDTAVDIAKETADIILLEKDLMVLEQGVTEGRKTFGNIVKYIKMAASGNFGNMVSVLVASIFLPFLPMLPIQILTQNLLNDSAQLGIPFDQVDLTYIRKPRKWETESIKRFMLVMGPLSSVFDILCFAILWWVMGFNSIATAPLFQAGWFVFGVVSQALVIYMIRTSRLPFIQSWPSWPLLVSTLLVSVIAVVIGFSQLATTIDMQMLPMSFTPWLIVVLVAYFISTQIVKTMYIKKYQEWL